MSSHERWFSPQPNVTGAGIIAAYSRPFWGIVVALGVIAGLGGWWLMALLHLVEHVAFGQQGHTLLAIVRAAPDWRRVASLEAAALVVIVGFKGLERLPTGGTEVADALWLRRGQMPLLSSIARGVLSIFTVGMGVPLGREAAPQLVGAATASWLAEWAQLPLWQRRLLVASGAGAGLAAVYNVPLGGTLFALEVMLGSLALPLVLPALLAAGIATAIAWIGLGTGPTYTVGPYLIHPTQLVWAVLAGPLIGLLATAWARLINSANRRRPRGGLRRYLAPFVVFAVVGLLAIPYPELLGNGRNIVELAILGHLSLGLLAILFVLKPMVSSGSVAAGSPGGLFTPTFAVGALFGGVAGGVWGHIWGGAAAGSYALIGGGAFLAAAMQGPLAGTVLVLELTRHFDALMVPTMLAVGEATIVSRWLGARSIYSARLPEEVGFPGQPAAGAAAVATLHALDENLPPGLTAPPARGRPRGRGRPAGGGDGSRDRGRPGSAGGGE